MKTIKILFVFTFLLATVSCEKIIMHPNPSTDNLSIFDEYVKIVKEKFGLFEVKNIDLDHLVDSLRPTITSNLSDEELFNKLGIITSSLQEGHTSLEYQPLNYFATYYYYEDYPISFNWSVSSFYYDEEYNPTVKFIGSAEYDSWRVKYGRLPKDNDIGFIRIFTYDIELTKEDIETMLNDLKDTKGLIIDVRVNLGGFVLQASQLASYFTTETIEVGTNYIKNGPGENDFAASKIFLEPSGSSFTYTKPIMVLHDRTTFSSGSLFTIMMYQMDHVTTVGQIFGGGTGEIIYGYLSNGWKYALSTSNFEDSYGRPTDNGIEPDIPVLLDENDTVNDAIIDRAMLELQTLTGIPANQ